MVLLPNPNPKGGCAHADDDSWLNLPLLQTYLAQYDETLPFGIGWMWDREFNETINFFSGGSGMFFSQVP